MKQKISRLGCVCKRDWKSYKTCNECGIRKKCEHKDKPNWFGRLIESVVVGWYRRRINRKLKGLFGRMSKNDVKRLSDIMKINQHIIGKKL